jgi:hypothetical protein
MNGARNIETKRRSRKAERPRSPHQNELNFLKYPLIEVSMGTWFTSQSS